MGDFNLPPEDVAGTLGKGTGSVVATPEEPTCTTAAGQSTIEYFVVDKLLAAGIANVETWE